MFNLRPSEIDNIEADWQEYKRKHASCSPLDYVETAFKNYAESERADIFALITCLEAPTVIYCKEETASL